MDRFFKDLLCQRITRFERLAHVLAGDRADISFNQIDDCLSPLWLLLMRAR